MGAVPSSSNKRKRPLHTDFSYWDYNQFTIRIQTPTLDRLVLVGVNEALWHEWDTRFDVLILDTRESERQYPEIIGLLKSPPNHVLDFRRTKEVARFPTCAQGVDRWRPVAKLLTMPVPWEGGPNGSEVGKGLVFRNLFGRANKAAIDSRTVRSSERVADCEMRVWYRFQRNQKVDNFVKAAGRELVN